MQEVSFGVEGFAVALSSCSLDLSVPGSHIVPPVACRFTWARDHRIYEDEGSYSCTRADERRCEATERLRNEDQIAFSSHFIHDNFGIFLEAGAVVISGK